MKRKKTSPTPTPEDLAAAEQTMVAVLDEMLRKTGHIAVADQLVRDAKTDPRRAVAAALIATEPSPGLTLRNLLR